MTSSASDTLARPPVDVPALSGSRLEVLARLMDWVHGRVIRRFPDEEWIRSRFLRRTVTEILADGYTLAYAPCVDRTLVTHAVLGAYRIDSYMIVHASANGLWHLVMELELEDGSWVFADYGTQESRLYPGRYRFARAQPQPPRLIRMRAPRYGPDIWDARPPLRFLAGMRHDMRTRFDDFVADLPRYREMVADGRRCLDDRMVADPDHSVYRTQWRDYPVVSVDSPEVGCVDMPSVRLFLERGPR